MTPQSVQSWLDENFARIVADRGVPGASVAVLADGQVFAAAAGVTNVETKVEVDTATVFQIGSITKLWTAALVMQLVDDGLLDIDQPIQGYLPEFEISDKATSATITTRQILTHVSGIEGDIFTDTGRGDDCIEKYVASIHDVLQVFAPGEVFSYSNTGYVVLGRLVEVLRGKPFDEVLLERLAGPLGLTSVSPSPYEAIVHRVAMGHVDGEDGAMVPAPFWAMARSNGPAGSMLAMTPSDLLAFVRMHLDQGVASDGTVILKPETVAEMRAEQVKLPRLTGMGGYWGLGWEMEQLDGQTVIGHDGGTVGQAAFMRLVPEAGVAVALLTNGGDFFGIFRDVVGHLVSELAGVSLPGLPVPPAESADVDVTPFLGTYSDTIYDFTVSQDADGTVWLDRVPKDMIAEIGGEPIHTELRALDADSMIAVDSMHGIHPIYAFVGRNEAGLAKYVHYGRVVSRAD